LGKAATLFRGAIRPVKIADISHSKFMIALKDPKLPTLAGGG
jgi:hypothetical protein